VAAPLTLFLLPLDLCFAFLKTSTMKGALPVCLLVLAVSSASHWVVGGLPGALESTQVAGTVADQHALPLANRGLTFPLPANASAGATLQVLAHASSPALEVAS
jgi:hypothetical protein